MSNLFIPIFLMYARDKILYMIFRTSLNNFLRCPEADGVYWRVKDLSLNFDRQFPMVFIFVLVQDNQQWELVTKNIGMFLLLKLVLPVDNIIAILECSLFKVQVILWYPLSVECWASLLLFWMPLYSLWSNFFGLSCILSVSWRL